MILKLKKLGLSFWLIVALPTVLSIFYYGFIAADQYVSASNFVVRSPQKNTSVSGLSAVLQGVGFSRSQDDAHVVTQYMLSRDAVVTLDKEMDLRDKFRRAGIDFFSRYNPIGIDNSYESLFDYYKKKVSIDLDTASSISTLTVRAYTADDAKLINGRLLEMAEGLVNQLNERGRQDTVAYAEKEVDTARKKLQESSVALMRYRADNRLIDIDKQATIQLQMVSKLQDQLIVVRAQLAQLRAVTPENPQIVVLRQREKSILKDIQSEMQKMTGGGQGVSLNEKSAEFERLSLDKDIATKQLAAALASWEQSKSEAQKKQIYLERIAQPNLPDVSTEPKRIKSILSVILFSMLIWFIWSLLSAGVKEHSA